MASVVNEKEGNEVILFGSRRMLKQLNYRLLKDLIINQVFVGVRGFEPPASWSRTRRSNRAEPHPEIKKQ